MLLISTSSHCFHTNGFLAQPAFLVAIIAAKDNLGLKQPVNEASFGTLGSVKPSLVDALLQVIERSDDLINRYIV